MAEQAEIIEAAVAAAREVCPRIATKRSYQSLQSEIVQLQQLLVRELPQRAEQEEVRDQYLDALDKFNNAKEAIKDERKALQV